MRGVYSCAGSLLALVTGSSPHARGLLTGMSMIVSAIRIIPACAGFTHLMILSVCPPADHPRMRGVYVGAEYGTDIDSGSSPHARGLLDIVVLIPQRPGIIPACAGFTPRSWAAS